MPFRYGALVRVLGIDPGSHHTGYGVVEREGNRLKLLACGTLSPERSLPLAKRLAVIHEGLRQVVERFTPDAASVEEIYYAVNARSALVLGQARGAAVVAVAAASIELFEYAPSEIKRAVSGSGRAGKEQVSRMVGMLLGREIPGDEHGCDAIAAAICHLNRSRSLDEVDHARVAAAPRRRGAASSLTSRLRPAVIPAAAPAGRGRR